MSEEHSVVGRRVPRWEAAEKATGGAKFLADIRLPGMLAGKILFSPHAHAKILDIDTSKAQRVPGVEAVLTDKVRFVGDRVAAVAAVDVATAQQALELIKVKYEVLPPVFDAMEAMKPGAPKIHDYAEKNVSVHFGFPVAWGDVEKGFGDAVAVVEKTFRTAGNHICQMEPCTCIASFGAGGRLTIWSPSQHAFLHRRKVAEIFSPAPVVP